MATAAQVKALIKSHAEGDDSRFFAVAMQVAAKAARAGHGKLAVELRALIDQAKAKKESSTSHVSQATPLAQPRGELAGLLTVAYPLTRLADLALELETLERIERVLLEQRQRGRIQEFGLTPQRRVLLVGPPGTGKTMTASVLAGELSLPLFSIQLHSLITKFMGETAAKLRLIFDALDETRGVYFFDEFDALGGERAAKNDVGEIRRVLNSFLQFLEQDSSDSLVIAATNFAGLLDRALFRRFDAVIEYQLPSEGTAAQVMKARLSVLRTDSVNWDEAGKASDGLSHAEIARACEQAAKNAILSDRDAICTAELVASLSERRPAG